MKWLKILEEDNIHVIVGLGSNGEREAAAAYAEMARRAASTRKRRFTLHVVSMKPYPIYLEDLRELILSNIAYTLTVRYHDFNLQKMDEFIQRLKEQNQDVFGVVSRDLAELSTLLKKHGVEIVEV